MENHHVATTLQQLSSLKLKDRNNALNELTEILKSDPMLLPDKSLHLIAESLIEILDLEHRKYTEILTTSNSSNKMTLVENRLSMGAYVMRLFIEESRNRLKIKTMKLLLAALPELMITANSRVILEPVGISLTVALKLLIESNVFRWNFTPYQWIELVESTSDCLLIQLSLTPNGQVIFNLIEIINILVSMDTIELKTVCWKLFELTKVYTKYQFAENSTSLVFFKLANQLIIRAHCIALEGCFMLIKRLWEYILTLENVSNHELLSEVVIFDHFSSELISNKMPSWTIRKLEQSELDKNGEFLDVFQQYVTMRLRMGNKNSLDLAGIRFLQNKSFTSDNYFCLRDFQLKDSSRSDYWLQWMSLAKILKAYFDLNALHSRKSLLFKKQKKAGISSMLNWCHTFDSFMSFCISETHVRDFGNLGLKIAGFYISLYDLDQKSTDNLKLIVIKSLDMIECKGFALFALIPLIRKSDISLSLDSYRMVLKHVFSSINTSSYANLACSLMTTLMLKSTSIMFDDGIVTFFRDILDNPERNGPYYLSPEAVEFWINFINIFPPLYESRNYGKYQALRWLYSKFKLKFSHIELNQFEKFLEWVYVDRIDPINPLRSKIMSSYENLFDKWNSMAEQRTFLLQTKMNLMDYSPCEATDEPETSSHYSPKLPSMIFEIVDKLKNSHCLTSSMLLCWACTFLQFIDNMLCCGTDDQDCNALVLAIQDMFPTVEDMLHEDQSTIAEHLFKTALEVRSKRVRRFLFEYIVSMKKIISLEAPDQIKGHASYNILTGSSDMAIRKRTNEESRHDRKVILPFIKSLIVLHDGKGFGLYQNLLSALEYYPIDDYLEVVLLMSRYLDLFLCDKSMLKDLDFLAQSIATKLLCSTYNTYNNSTFVLIEFLKATLSLWSDPMNQNVSTDCNDIYEWVLSRFVDHSICGTKVTIGIAELLLRILSTQNFHKTSIKGGKQKTFDLFITALSRLSFPEYISLLPNITEYVNKLSHKNQLIVIEEVFTLYCAEQSGIEFVAYYWQSMVFYFENVPLLRPFLLRDMIKKANEFSNLNYVNYALNYLVESFSRNDRRCFFEEYKFEIIDQWFDTYDQDISYWDIGLFGFKSVEEFVSIYYNEVYSLYFSKGLGNPDFLRNIIKVSGQTETELLSNNIASIIPLSHVDGNIGDVIFEVIRGKTILREAPKDSTDLVLFVKRIADFIDYGNPVDFDIRVSGSRILNDFLGMKRNFEKYLRYKGSIRFSLDKGIQLLQIYLSDREPKPLDFRFVVVWVQNEICNAQTELGRIQKIRELKFILAYFWENLNDSELISSIIETITPFLSTVGLKDEISDFMATVLDACPTTMIDHACLSGLLAKLLEIKTLNHTSQFQSLCDSLKKFVDGGNVHEDLCWLAWQLVTESRKQNPERLTDRFLENGLASFQSIQLFAYVLKNIDVTVVKKYNWQPTPNKVDNLLHYTNSIFRGNDNFNLFLASYLTAHYYSTLGRSSSRKLLGKDSFRHLSEASFENAVSSFVVDYYVSPPFRIALKNLFFFEIIVGFLVGNAHSERASRYRSDIEIGNRLPLKTFQTTELILKSVYTPVRSMFRPDVTTFEECFNTDKIYEYWIIGLIEIVTSGMAPMLGYLSYVITLCHIDSTFAQKWLTFLILLGCRFEHSAFIDYIEKMVENLETLTGTTHANQKIQFVLDLIINLRSKIKCYEGFKIAYLKIDKVKILGFALNLHAGKLSYMLYEEIMYSDASKDRLVQLGDIYKCIDDRDLISSLPTRHNILGIMDSINNTENLSFKSFRINNAYLDSVKGDITQSQRLTLVKAAESEGYQELSGLLYKDRAYSLSSDSYKWNLQLEKWTLPLVKKFDSKPKFLYSLISDCMNEAVDFDVLDGFVIELLNSRKNYESFNEWMETIAELDNLRILHRACLGDDDLKIALNTIKNRTIHDFHHVAYKDYKLNIKARELFMSALVKRQGLTDQQRIRVGSSLAYHYKETVNLAVENNVPQDAIRNTISFQNYFDRYYRDKTPESLSVQEALSYTTALASWELKEYKVPLQILRNLFKSKKWSLSKGKCDYDDPCSIPFHSIQSHLVQWSCESRAESAQSIFQNYIEDIDHIYKTEEVTSKALDAIASFLHKEVETLEQSEVINSKKKRLAIISKELQDLQILYRNGSLPENERKEAKKYYMKLSYQLDKDQEIVKELQSQKSKFICNALHYYISSLVLTNDNNNAIIDKLCALWFQYDGESSVNRFLYNEISSVPSWKFLPWVNQIASKLASVDSEFQKALQLTMKRLLYKLPYESLYSILCIKLYESHYKSGDIEVQSKAIVINKILKDLAVYEEGKFYSEFVLPILTFAENSVDLAMRKFPKHTKEVNLGDIKNGDYWLRYISQFKIPLPTISAQITCSSDGRKPRPYIVSADENMLLTTTGLSLPKIMTVVLSDGSKHKILLKGSNDDLRQDAIMEQVFEQVNNIISRDKELNDLELRIRTYKVIPLGPQAGIIEFVPNSIALHEVLTSLHAFDKITFDQARKSMKAVQNKNFAIRVETYNSLVKEIAPKFHEYFFNNFREPDAWYSAKMKYTKGVASTSIIGHILGLGDRHLNNILIDTLTGEPIHIDLGVAFDQGRLLTIPELVPFRLTREIVDGFGVNGVEGPFRKNCERVYAKLRQDSEKLMCVLNVLKWDPLYSWVISPMRRYRHLLEVESDDDPGLLEGHFKSMANEEENQESYRAIRSVQEKLEGKGLSIEATVEELIQQATSVENLALIYMGWSPFY